MAKEVKVDCFSSPGELLLNGLLCCCVAVVQCHCPCMSCCRRGAARRDKKMPSGTSCPESSSFYSPKYTGAILI